MFGNLTLPYNQFLKIFIIVIIQSLQASFRDGRPIFPALKGEVALAGLEEGRTPAASAKKCGSTAGLGAKRQHWIKLWNHWIHTSCFLLKYPIHKHDSWARRAADLKCWERRTNISFTETDNQHPKQDQVLKPVQPKTKYGRKINFVGFYGDVLCVADYLVFNLTWKSNFFCKPCVREGPWEAVFQTTAFWH